MFAQVLSGAEVVSEERVLHKPEGRSRYGPDWSKTLGMGPIQLFERVFFTMIFKSLF